MTDNRLTAFLQDRDLPKFLGKDVSTTFSPKTDDCETKLLETFDDLQTKTQENEKLDATIEEWRRIIDDLVKQNKTLETEKKNIEEQGTTIQTQKQTIVEQNTRITEQDKIIQNQETTIERKDKTIKQQQTDIEQCKAEIALIGDFFQTTDGSTLGEKMENYGEALKVQNSKNKITVMLNEFKISLLEGKLFFINEKNDWGEQNYDAFKACLTQFDAITDEQEKVYFALEKLEILKNNSGYFKYSTKDKIRIGLQGPKKIADNLFKKLSTAVKSAASATLPVITSAASATLGGATSAVSNVAGAVAGAVQTVGQKAADRSSTSRAGRTVATAGSAGSAGPAVPASSAVPADSTSSAGSAVPANKPKVATSKPEKTKEERIKFGMHNFFKDNKPSLNLTRRGRYFYDTETDRPYRTGNSHANWTEKLMSDTSLPPIPTTDDDEAINSYIKTLQDAVTNMGKP